MPNHNKYSIKIWDLFLLLFLFSILFTQSHAHALSSYRTEFLAKQKSINLEIEQKTHINNISKYFLWSFLITVLSLLLRLSGKFTIFKDTSDLLLVVFDLLLFYIRKHLEIYLGNIVFYFALIISAAIIVNSFIYNRYKIIRTLLSIASKFAFVVLAFYVFLAEFIFIYGIKENINKNLVFFVSFLATLIAFILLINALKNPKQAIEGKYKLILIYIIAGYACLAGSILYAFYLAVYKHYLVALEILGLGLLAKLVFLILENITIKQHVKAIIKRFNRKKAKEYSVAVFNSKEVNAFAFLDKKGRKAIGVTRPLVKMFNVNEINFAIAHEYSHHEANHMIVKMFGNALTLGGIFGIMTIMPAGIFPFSLVALFGIFHLGKKYVYKEEEYEADSLGVGALKKAKLTQKGAISFFEKLEKEFGSKKTAASVLVNIFFEDHPFTDKRKKNVESLAEF